MKPAFLKDDALLEDIEVAPSVPDAFRVWWLGQSGFLLAWNGHRLLFDPYLSDSLSKKYAATDKPHVRVTERVVDPRRLAGIEVVTSSHNHTDHLDAETLRPLLESCPEIEIVVPHANVDFAAERLGLPRSRLRPGRVGAPLRAGVFELVAVPAAHEAIELDESGAHRFVGWIASFGPFRVYHSGDTVLYEGIVETLEPCAIDLALLPINGRAPERRVAGNLDAHEAATLAREIGARWVVPCHYDLFEFNTASPEPFRAECERIGQSYRILRNGEGWTVGSDRTA